jgi:hypothetical protein
MHDILILTAPVELVGMLKSLHKCDILILTALVVGGNAKITKYDILILTEPVELVNAKIIT